MIAHDIELDHASTLMPVLTDLVRYLHHAAQTETRVDQVEEHVFRQLLVLGKEALRLFFRLSGTGDLGQQVALPDGSHAERLDELHTRPYRSVFGDFVLERTCYGSREGQKITFVPLDNRLQLPEGDYSYVLQRWDATLGAESAFARVAATLKDILGIKQPVGSLEQNIRHMAASVESFRESRPVPRAAEEGEVFVVSADGKGVVIRRGPGDPPPKARRGKGDKANQKRMAMVGAIYSVDRYPRTPEEMTAALFRDPRRPEGPVPTRPVPVGKHVWGRLSRAKDGSLDEPIGTVFSWLGKELKRRQRSSGKEVVCLIDGQEALWTGLSRIESGAVEVLDILHVTPRLWRAAHLFHKEGTAEAVAFVRERVLRVLKGEVKGVVKGLRRMGTDQGLIGARKKKLKTISNYLSGNAGRMRYDEYLSKGYPIASGVIEGACRHYVKDRMERSGMRWVKAGAQAMLDVRSEYVNGDWARFQEFRINRERERLYPNHKALKEYEWPLAV